MILLIYETCTEEKGWEVMKERLPKTHEWTCRYAERPKRKRRAKVGKVLDKKKRGK